MNRHCCQLGTGDLIMAKAEGVFIRAAAMAMTIALGNWAIAMVYRAIAIGMVVGMLVRLGTSLLLVRAWSAVLTMHRHFFAPDGGAQRRRHFDTQPCARRGIARSV